MVVFTFFGSLRRSGMNAASSALALCAGWWLGLASGMDAPGPRTLRIAYAQDAKTLDPALAVEADNFELLPLLFTPLLDSSDATRILPTGVRDWSHSPDWREFTFHLRPELRFSNGRRVVAADYAYALERIANPETGSMTLDYLKGIRGAADVRDGKTSRLAGVATPDPDTLIVELETSDVTFPFVMSVQAVPREALEQSPADFATRPVCTGPYQVAEWRRGHRMLLVPNPCYGGAEPRRFERIEILFGLDEATQMMMFERGELDAVRLPFSQLQRTRREPWLTERTTSISMLSSRFLVMNTEIPPLNDVRVRQAISHAIDRDRRMLVKTGWCEPANGIIPPAMPGHNPGLTGLAYAPERAHALLAAAGIKLPLRLALWYNPVNAVLAQGIAADLDQAGIHLELKAVAQAQLDEATAHRGEVALSLNGWTTSLPDPKDLLATQFDGRQVGDESWLNVAFYNNPELNRLLDEASATIELPLRYARYQHIEQIVVQDAPYVFLGHPRLFALRQAWVKGPLLDPGTGFRWDRIWMEPAPKTKNQYGLLIEEPVPRRLETAAPWAATWGHKEGRFVSARGDKPRDRFFLR